MKRTDVKVEIALAVIGSGPYERASSPENRSQSQKYLIQKLFSQHTRKLCTGNGKV